MLRHRLVAGSLLAAGIGAVLVADASFAPYYPVLLACALIAGLLATRELVALLPKATRPRLDVCLIGVLAVLVSNWSHVAFDLLGMPTQFGPRAWEPVVYAYAATVLVAFLVEMATFREPGGCVGRVANTALTVAYLGLLPSFFVKLRWLPEWSGLALTLTVFVPKCGDIGAYFTGRMIGKHPFSPLLSPKKTWEGFAGGMLTAVATAVGLSFAGSVFRYGIPEAVGFGLAVGLAGIYGDLAESLVKRDCGAKDAARSIPGFGGLLDVLDSVLFAGPVAYWWLSR
ncbi:phosphatidate cytidylyltransferase [Fimbriiglobus ruber]|uniref:Phosphatidate cytidylyltransferase n=1 Tax=Fimbriiglobus ruber TaxID=1908690 RepID=A0A225DDS7_9BACT|nr:phosphatidate cytidylyltransferase [Fimbriiglobus ruber]OWK34555.1 Phosphatidate cytidylyltransferase [Fimbriiglobus ruber]